MNENDIRALVEKIFDEKTRAALYNTKNYTYHTHNGIDSPILTPLNIPFATVGGANTNVQFNNNGAFGGSSEFTFDNSGLIKTLEVNNGSEYAQLRQDGLAIGTVGNPYNSYYSLDRFGNVDPTTNSDNYTAYSTIKTTSAAPTTIDSVFYTSTQTNFIEARVVGRRTGGTSGSAGDSAAYIIRAVYQGGTIIGSISVDFIQESQAGWDATFSVGVGIIDVVVTGAANNNVSWSCSLQVQEISN